MKIIFNIIKFENKLFNLKGSFYRFYSEIKNLSFII